MLANFVSGDENANTKIIHFSDCCEETKSLLTLQSQHPQYGLKYETQSRVSRFKIV